VPDPLKVKQGTTRTVALTGLRDSTGALLDPTGWAIHGVARPGVWADPVAVWRDTPDTGAGELATEVVDADPAIDPTVEAGEKWIDLHIDPDVSLSWVTWREAELDVTITEPGTGRTETFHSDLHLIPTTVRADSTGPPPPVSPTGGGSSIRFTEVAATVLSGHRVVTRQTDGTVGYASNDDLADVNAPLWITTGAAASGALVTVVAYGVIDEPSWAWTPGPVYLGSGGLITQTPPAGPGALFIAQIGFATSPTSVFVERSSSITLV
jgi:hypothetical protein